MTVRLGIAHVSGAYPTPTGSQLQMGINRIVELSCSIVKLHLTPRYMFEYSSSFWPSTSSVTSLATLASTSEFAFALGHPRLDTIFLTSYTFANGVNNPWNNGVTPAMLSNEKQELKDLTRHLITTYSGTNKTFVLQNSEGDWAMLGAFDEALQVPRRRVDYYAAVMRSRQEGVEEGRRELGQPGVKVLHSIEANRVIDGTNKPHMRRLVNHVIPKVSPDAVSYSAYDSMDYYYNAVESITLDEMDRRLSRSIQELKRCVPGDGPVFVTEFGWPQRELPAGNNAYDLVRRAVQVFDREGVECAVYWQIYDNEFTGSDPLTTCRGFWIVDPTGNLGDAGRAYQELLLTASYR